MGKIKYPHLFTPLQAAGTLFRNRIFTSPQGFYNVTPELFPNADAVAFYENKARGGAAAVCVGDCIVDRHTGKHYNFLFRIDDENSIPGFSALASAVRRHGAVPSAELSHAGMYAQSVLLDGNPLYGPVEMENKYGHVNQMPEEMIFSIIDSYGKAAALAKQAGFGMVTIHGGHGWLLSQFWSSKINTRNDKWGGSFENRMRLPLAVIDEVRRNVGAKFPIEYRMSGSECIPEGYDIDEGIEFAKAIDEKVDLIHVSAGNHEYLEGTIVTHPSMFDEDGCNLKYAAAIKKHVKSPIVTVGAFTDPAHMEEVIASGQADIIALGRQSLADPDLPIKARTGKDDEINRCMRCSCCFGNGGQHRIYQCATNPTIGHEVEAKSDIPPKYKKKVLIVGGGVGGMQAALTAAERGHQVILCEKTDRLGGVLLCEENIPFKQKLSAYLKKQALLISRAPIDLRMNTLATPKLAEKLNPDVIIAAVGAQPAVPNIPGIEGKNVFGAEDIYLNPDKAGKRVIILGGGLVGLELGIYLSMNGRQVTVLEMLPEPSLGKTGMHAPALMVELGRRKIDLRTNTSVKEITTSGVVADGPDGQFTIDADTVIYAVGQRPLREEAIAFSSCAGEFYQIGDCLAPESIMSATQAAYTIAKDIGRI